MRLHELVVGKTIVSVGYKDHEFVGIEFSDGTYLRIDQSQQAGALRISCLLGNEQVVHTAVADNLSDDGEELE
jgi:hypothetical protein